jgi:hypothetical protein
VRADRGAQGRVLAKLLRQPLERIAFNQHYTCDGPLIKHRSSGPRGWTASGSVRWRSSTIPLD